MCGLTLLLTKSYYGDFILVTSCSSSCGTWAQHMQKLSQYTAPHKRASRPAVPQLTIHLPQRKLKEVGKDKMLPSLKPIHKAWLKVKPRLWWAIWTRLSDPDIWIHVKSLPSLSALILGYLRNIMWNQLPLVIRNNHLVLSFFANDIALDNKELAVWGHDSTNHLGA